MAARQAGQSLPSRAWHPRPTGQTLAAASGSKVNPANLTSAVIDTRDFLAAWCRAETEGRSPAGITIVASGGLDDEIIWEALDKSTARRPVMVLADGGSPKGSEHIAARWAANRGVARIVFNAVWNRHNRAALFRHTATTGMTSRALLYYVPRYKRVYWTAV